jgi:hypothetical protein
MKRWTALSIALAAGCGGGGRDGGDDLFGEGSASQSASGVDGTGSASGNDGSGDADGSGGTGNGPGSGQDSADSAEGGIKLDVAAGETGPNPECLEGMDCGGCTAVDLLFVIDNSVSMNDYQVALGQAFPGFADAIIAALPPGTNLHVGVTSTEMGYSSSGSTSNCQAQGDSGQPQEAFYITPDAQDTGKVGAQGRLYPSQGMPYYEIDTDAGPAEVQGLKDWFAGAANIGEGGSQVEMSSAAAGWAADPVNTGGPNAGFLRDEGAVLVVFFIQDEPDQSDAPGMTMQETGVAMLDKIAAAKAGCGGLSCVVAGGFVDEGCLTHPNGLGAFLEGMEKPAPTETLPWDDENVDPGYFAPLLEETLAQVIAQTCDEIDPEG